MDARALDGFLSLPLNPQESWQGGVVDAAELLGIPPEASPIDLRVVLWRSEASELVHARPMLPEAGDTFGQFLDAMLALSEENEFPFRPARIDCNDQRLADELSRELEGTGTVVEFRAKMGTWKNVLNEIVDALQPGGAPPHRPSLREAGCSDQQIACYAIAASRFYRAGLWELLDDTDLIKIEKPRPPKHLKYGVVLGAASKHYGLGLYDSPDIHHTLMRQEADPRDMSFFSFTYDDPASVAPGDADLWRELGLPLETGEALPDANLFNRKGPRRPTPKELDFLTLVLEGLAQTTEAEIDSGRWSKEIVVGGKPRSCVFSIPNLLDPPDHAEWLRRGKAPDRRGFEVHQKRVMEFLASQPEDIELDDINALINQRFVGVPIDSYETPRTTPAERAQTLCQEAYSAYGRRRVQLARQAVAEDPTHADALILMAELTRDPDASIDLYRRAKQTAADALGDEMEEMAGEFWGYLPTRPYMRACQGLAGVLQRAGDTREAIDLYREMLRLNPNDNQGVRYDLLPLLLEQGCDGEALTLLQEYPEESARWLYSRALVEFRKSGNSAAATKAMRAAFKANPLLIEVLDADGPPFMPDSYSPGSREEATICVEELASLWDETEGYHEWMLKQYVLWEQDRTKRLREQKRREKAKSAKAKRWRKSH